MPTTCKINGQPYQLPTGWAELDAAQVLGAAVPARLAGRTPAARLALLAALVKPGIPEKIRRRLTGEQLYELTEALAWVWDAPFAEHVVEYFEYSGRTYRLPRPRLLDAVAIEYGVASIHFAAYLTHGRAESLDQLVATLCRPPRAGYDPTDPAADGQARERYNATLAEARALVFADLPLAVKFVVLERFVAAEQFIHATYHQVFTAPEARAPTGSRPPGPPSDGGRFLELVYELAQQGTYGTYEEVAQTDVHTILYNLHRAAAK